MDWNWTLCRLWGDTVCNRSSTIISFCLPQSDLSYPKLALDAVIFLHNIIYNCFDWSLGKWLRSFPFAWHQCMRRNCGTHCFQQISKICVLLSFWIVIVTKSIPSEKKRKKPTTKIPKYSHLNEQITWLSILFFPQYLGVSQLSLSLSRLRRLIRKM